MVEEKKAQYKDFEFLKSLGNGAYGEVLLAKKKDTGQQMAVKSISKKLLEKERKQYQIFIEKEILSRLDHVGVIKLYYSFQDQENLYLAVELCDSGDFADYLLGNFHKLNTETVQFYTAEMILIIEYIHKNGIAHRDLKPENLLITKERHLKVIDFGTALFFNTSLVPTELLEKIKSIREKHSEQIDKEMEEIKNGTHDTRERQGTFVGSPQYVSPELLETNLCGPEADLWSLGCMIYKMFANETPFNAENQYLIFQKIKEGKYPIPEHMPEEVQDLISKLLCLNPKARLGAGPEGSKNDYKALKNHPFFAGVDWGNIFNTDAPVRHVSIHKSNDDEMFKLQQINNDSSDEDNNSKDDNDKNWGSSKDAPILQGLVSKKVGWMYYKKRMVVLSSNPPRLIYFEPENGEKLGEITIDMNTKIQMVDKSTFTLEGLNKKGKTKKYYWKEAQQPATLWVEKIKKVIDEC